MSEWTSLTCYNCNGTLFLRPFSFIKHPTQGTSEKPHGVVCFTCGKDGDPGLMAARMETARRRKELEEWQNRMDEMEKRQKERDEQEFQDDPVEVRDIMRKRIQSQRQRAQELEDKKSES